MRNLSMKLDSPTRRAFLSQAAQIFLGVVRFPQSAKSLACLNLQRQLSREAAQQNASSTCI